MKELERYSLILLVIGDVLLAVRQLKWHVSWVSETLHMSPAILRTRLGADAEKLKKEISKLTHNDEVRLHSS